MQNKGQANAGIVAYGGVCCPVISVSCCSAFAGLSDERNAVDRNIVRSERILHGWASAGICSFDNIHLDVFGKQVGSGSKG